MLNIQILIESKLFNYKKMKKSHNVNVKMM